MTAAPSVEERLALSVLALVRERDALRARLAAVIEDEAEAWAACVRAEQAAQQPAA